MGTPVLLPTVPLTSDFTFPPSALGVSLPADRLRPLSIIAPSTVSCIQSCSRNNETLLIPKELNNNNEGKLQTAVRRASPTKLCSTRSITPSACSASSSLSSSTERDSSTSPSISRVIVRNSVGIKKRKDVVKDQAYWERRRKNNDAAKRSRDQRRIKEDEIAQRAAHLERENAQLRSQLETLRAESGSLHKLLVAPVQGTSYGILPAPVALRPPSSVVLPASLQHFPLHHAIASSIGSVITATPRLHDLQPSTSNAFTRETVLVQRRQLC